MLIFITIYAIYLMLYFSQFFLGCKENYLNKNKYLL